MPEKVRLGLGALQVIFLHLLLHIKTKASRLMNCTINSCNAVYIHVIKAVWRESPCDADSHAEMAMFGIIIIAVNLCQRAT